MYFICLILLIAQLILVQSGNIGSCNLDDVYLQLFGQIGNVEKSLEVLNARLDVISERHELITEGLEFSKRLRGTVKPIFDIRFDSIPKHCNTELKPSSCAQAMECTCSSGIYNITDTRYSKRTFTVYCDYDNYEGDWLYILKRHDGSENFNRHWTNYVKGFGNAAGEYWIGLENLYALTNYYGTQELNVFLEDFEGRKKFARYDNFVIGSAFENYKLKSLGRYWGTAGDSLYNHMGAKFSTYDNDNDASNGSCAVTYNGGFWFKSCGYANPTGSYLRGSNARKNDNSHWYSFGGYYYSHKTIIFMIRRQRPAKLE